MRSIWKGEVSFGLVNVPVKVYSATEDHDLHARQVDKKDGVRIRYKKVRDDNGEEVEFSDIAKAYESEDCEMVILTKEDLASLPVEQSHEIEVTEFVPADQVDPVAFDSAYFLEPASRSNRAYVLMREALESTDRLAICTFTLRNRTRLCALRVYKDVLMLQTLLWPDEIRPAILEGLDKEAKVRPQKVKMAASLIETMAADFEPERYEDDYQLQLKELIEAKAAGGEAFTVEEREEASDDDGDDEVADLLAAPRASVKDRGGTRTLAKMTTPRRDFHPRLWAIRVSAVISTSVMSTSRAAHSISGPRPSSVRTGAAKQQESRAWWIAQKARAAGHKMRPVSTFSARCRA